MVISPHNALTQKLANRHMDNEIEPIDYLRKWIPIKTGKYEGEYGWKKACIEEIHVLTGYEPSTISTWSIDFSKAPVQVRKSLFKEDILNGIEQEMERRKKTIY